MILWLFVDVFSNDSSFCNDFLHCYVRLTYRHWFVIFVLTAFVNGLITDFFGIYTLRTGGAEWLTVIGLAEALFFSFNLTINCSCSVSAVSY